MDLSEVYVDEDRALGFHVWVAELELLVGTARGRNIDQVGVRSLQHTVQIPNLCSYCRNASQTKRHACFKTPNEPVDFPGTTSEEQHAILRGLFVYQRSIRLQVAAFELLQKVLVNIVPSEVDRVREYQRRCELALIDILLQGAASPVGPLKC